MWQLIINGPGYFNTSYDLPAGVTTLGRADDNDIVLSGDLVSRKHASVAVREEGLFLTDLGSRNGTRVNSEVIRAETALKDGDTVTVGENSLSILRPAQARKRVDSGSVRHYGSGSDISEAVIVAKELRDSYLVRALDNVPFPPPTAENVLAPPPSAYEHLIFLYRAAERLGTSQSLEEFLEATIDELIARTGATTAVVLLKHSDGSLVPATVRHRAQLQEGEVPVSDAIVEVALSDGRALAVADVNEDTRFSKRESVILYGAGQVLCVPLGSKPSFLGVLYVNRPASPGDVGLSDLLDLCSGVGNLLVSALQKFSGKESVEERLMRSLERFLPPAMASRRAAELRKSGKSRSTLMEARLGTVLVADLRHFASLCRELSPDQMGDLLGQYYTQMAGILFSFEGVLESISGDRLTAVFGYPHPRSDDGLRAARAAMAMRSAFETLKKKRQEKITAELRAGLATGPLHVGTVWMGDRVQISAVGPVHKHAEELCRLADNGQVLFTDHTLNTVGGHFEVTPIGERTLNEGKDRVAVFEVHIEDFGRLTKPGTR